MPMAAASKGQVCCYAGFWPGAGLLGTAVVSLRGRFGGRSRSLKLTATLSLRTCTMQLDMSMLCSCVIMLHGAAEAAPRCACS